MRTLASRNVSRRVPALLVLVLLVLCMAFCPMRAYADETVYDDDSKHSLDDPNTTYVIRGNGSRRVDGGYFTVPKDKSSEGSPITIILDNVNRSQADKSPNSSFITIEEGNYVVVKLRGTNYIEAGEDKQASSNDGMAGIHVAKGATVKVTSEDGDGSTNGSLEVHGGGGKNGGAGIGSRYNDRSGTIIIAGGTIKAYGGHCAAGIGAGRDGSVEIIQITGGDITAVGGTYAAGIGAGYGAAMDTTTADGTGIEDNITIAGGVVNAQGGEGGAGIGGGMVGDSMSSGHSGSILLSGTSHITAIGGRQGAGVGGGATTGNSGYGGCDKVVVDLTSVDNTTAKGPDAIGSDGGWLIATGGKGAAGIGAGGYLLHKDKTDPIPTTNDTELVEIKGGYVKATGGADDTDDAGLSTGSGAGIGGGAANTKLRCLEISGGWVEAYAGDANAADIGHGSKAGSAGPGGDDASNIYYISGGTVVANTLGQRATKVFDGGSITAKVGDAHNSTGTPVYQTTLKVPTESLVRVFVNPAHPYGTTPIYSDASQKVYLYLPVSEENKQTAEVVVGEDETYHYYGTTKDDNTGWLKIDGEVIPFKDPGTVCYGDKFMLELDDANLAEGTTWGNVHVSGSAMFATVIGITSPGMVFDLLAVGVGPISVNATTAGSSDPELYWGSKMDYTGMVVRAIPQIAFTEDPSKTYDGQPVTDPSVTTDSPGAVSYVYSTADGSAPKDAGTYTVTATVAGSEVYESASASMEFTIKPAPTALTLQLSQDNGKGTATATVVGLHEPNGVVSFTVNGGTPTEVAIGSDLTATLRDYEIPAGIHTVTAVFVPSSGGNYDGSEASATADKDLVTPVIQHSVPTGLSYADSSFNLNVEVLDGSTPIDDSVEVTCEVVWDYYGNRGLDSAITATGSGFDIQHAGKVLVKIAATPKPGFEHSYNPAVAFVSVDIAPAPLTVTSYVRNKGSEETVSTATYGALSNLESALRFSTFARNDTPETFTHGHGTLSASPLVETMGATEGYQVPILRNGPVATDGDSSRRTAFVARDYAITYAYDPITIAKRKVAIQALDTSGVYGGDEPRYDWDRCIFQDDYGCDNLATWDGMDAIFTTEPTIKLNLTNELAGKEYKDLPVGNYPGVIAPSGGISANYDIVYIPADLVVKPAPLSDKERFKVEVDDTVYNGQEQLQSVTVTDNALGKVLEMGESKDFNIAYLDDTINAGYVWATVRGQGNYCGYQVQRYAIDKATISVVTQSASKLYDGTPLTARGTATGILNNDATFEVTGTQTKPGSTRNSYVLSFADGKARNYRVSESVGTLEVKSNDVSGFDLSEPKDVTYDGLAHRPTVTLVDGDGKQLVEGTDYALSYKGSAGNLIDAGTVTITATGKGRYAGAKAVSFTIAPAPLSVTTEDATKPYDGTPLTAPGEIKGLVNGETATLVTKAITEVGSTVNGYKIRWDGTAKKGNYVIDHEDLGTLTVVEADPIPVKKGVLTFDLAGGTLDGKTGSFTIEANVGDVVKLPAAPTREGYTFKYWKGSQYAAGADYEVKGDHSFTAEWEKDAPAPSPVKPTPSPSRPRGPIPRTGDLSAGMLACETGLALASGLCLVLAVVGLRRRRGTHER